MEQRAHRNYVSSMATLLPDAPQPDTSYATAVGTLQLLGQIFVKGGRYADDVAFVDQVAWHLAQHLKTRPVHSCLELKKELELVTQGKRGLLDTGGVRPAFLDPDDNMQMGWVLSCINDVADITTSETNDESEAEYNGGTWSYQYRYHNANDELCTIDVTVTWETRLGCWVEILFDVDLPAIYHFSTRGCDDYAVMKYDGLISVRKGTPYDYVRALVRFRKKTPGSYELVTYDMESPYRIITMVDGPEGWDRVQNKALDPVTKTWHPQQMVAPNLYIWMHNGPEMAIGSATDVIKHARADGKDSVSMEEFRKAKAKCDKKRLYDAMTRWILWLSRKGTDPKRAANRARAETEAFKADGF